jgi:hypothetical protein
MAFDAPTETWSSDLKKTLQEDGKTSRQATRVMQAVSDDPTTDNEATAQLAFPPLYSIHPRLGVGFVLRDVNVKRKSPILFEATLVYKTRAAQDPDNDDGTQDNSYPWDEPASVEFFDIAETGPTELDYNGDPINNTVGDPIMDVQIERADQGIKITKNFLGYDPAAFYTYRNTVNNSTFLGFPKGTLRVVGINGTPNRHDEGTLYYTITVSLSARRPIGDTAEDKVWYARVANKGFNLKNPNYKDEKGPIYRNDDPITSPEYISEDGTEIIEPGGSIHWLYFQLYNETDFAGMNLFS